LPARDASGEWTVRARFVTPEVRRDARGLLADERDVSL
jgi:hypothetical protein